MAARLEEVLQQKGHESGNTYLDRRGVSAQVLSHASLRERAMLRALVLESSMPAGSICLLVMPTGPEFLITLLGCLYSGMVAVPLPEPRFVSQSRRLDAVLRDSGAAAVLCTSSNEATLKSHFSGSGSHPCPVIPMDSPETLSAYRSKPSCLGMVRSKDRPVIVQYTSGSTMQPKGVALSSRNILSNADMLRVQFDYLPDDIGVNWLPHYHDMGLFGGLLYPLLSGYNSVQLPPLAFVQHPARWLQAISDYRGTASGGPAFSFALCVETVTDEQLSRLDLASWRRAYCGAEPVPSDLMRRFRSRFAQAGLDPGAVFASYGLAEATLFAAGRPPRPDDPHDAVGERKGLEPARLTPDSRESLRVVDPDTLVPVPDGVEGEIWVSGPSVASGYLHGRDPETFNASLPGSPKRYLRTGDLGWIGPGGLYISGRLKDMLIANGANVAAIDVEWLAAGCHESLNPLAAAAVPILREDGVEAAGLLIEGKTASSRVEDAPAVAEAIRRAVRAEHGIDLQVVRFLRKGSLERTTSGKIRRRQVAESLREGRSYPEIAA